MATTDPLRAHGRGTFAVVLAGGKGTRLFELTQDQCKPSLYFAGRSRLIDFTLANLVRSGLLDALVLTQYKPSALLTHLAAVWHRRFAARGGRLTARDSAWIPGLEYRGTADAVFQNTGQIEAYAPHDVLILGADHIYDMDYGAMIAAHRASGAAVTMAADVVPRWEACGFGVLETYASGRAKRFLEKPLDPPGIPDAPDFALASMGIYVFSWLWLRSQLLSDAYDSRSSHDFGHDILPYAVMTGQLNVHRFSGSNSRAYWRDVGTLDAYREAAITFASDTRPCSLPHEGTALMGEAEFPVVAPQHCADSVVMPGASLPRSARLRKAIIAPGTVVPAHLVVGENPAEDARWFRVTPGGTTLVTPAMLARWHALRPSHHPSLAIPATVSAIKARLENVSNGVIPVATAPNIQKA